MLNRFRWWLTFVVEKWLLHLPHHSYAMATSPGDRCEITRWYFRHWELALIDGTIDFKRERRWCVAAWWHYREPLRATCPPPLLPLLNYVLPLEIRQRIADWVSRGPRQKRDFGMDYIITVARRGPLGMSDGLGFITVVLGKLVFSIEK